MKLFSKFKIGFFFILFILSACSKNDSNYPNEYVGFEKSIMNYTLDKNIDEKEISLKIIAAEKKNVDREVVIMGKWKPGEDPAFRLLDTEAVIPARKKSASIRVRFYPKKIKYKKEILLVCTPKYKDAKQTQIALRLSVK